MPTAAAEEIPEPGDDGAKRISTAAPKHLKVAHDDEDEIGDNQAATATRLSYIFLFP